ncbi:MAG TPA: serine hydrolase, partial [Longimicrobiales bacterium]|nr:serine hydrolase [Longimicrobiales bacterium]
MIAAAKAGVLMLALAAGGSEVSAQVTFPPDSAVRRLLDERVRDGRAAGLVVGMIEADGSSRWLSAGRAGDGRTLGPETVFEIGSITKVFTGVLLADMVRRGEVSLDDPVSKYLPSHVTVPVRDGKAITLAHLSTQTSGLPRLPSNLRPADPTNPYADYTVEQLYEFLGGYTLARDPGAQYEYSNLGAGLLGHALALRAGTSYEELVRVRILEPLRMHDTGITLTAAQRQRMAAGHEAGGDTVSLWDLPTLAGAGALRSTMADMLKFADAALRGTGPVHDAMREALRLRAPAGSPTMGIGLGWHRLAVQPDTIVWHNGGTGGFRSFIGVVPTAGRAVVLLTNSGGGGSDDLALHLLNPSLPLAPPPRQAVEVPAALLERYVGTYDLAPTFSLVITFADGALRMTPTGQGTVRLWAESDTKFFIREVDAQVTFDVAADG